MLCPCLGWGPATVFIHSRKNHDGAPLFHSPHLCTIADDASYNIEDEESAHSVLSGSADASNLREARVDSTEGIQVDPHLEECGDFWDLAGLS